MKILELFGGIGACTTALKRLGIPYEIADYVEIDKYAVASYNAINGTNFKPQDICEWDKDIECDLIMHGSPCQDFSVAGKQAGGDENSGTRSSLMYETLRIVAKLKPKYVIWENVKNLLSHKHRHNFDNYLNRMNELGYENHYQVLNAKDYGIPQNRERVFTISIRNDIEKEFVFPEKQELKLRLKDMLEPQVDEKYYLSEKMLNYIAADNEKWTGNNEKSIINKTIASARNTGEGSRRCDASNYVAKPYEKAINIKNAVELKSNNKRLETLVNNTEFEQGKILNMDLYNQTTNENISQCLTEPHHNSQALYDGLRIRKLTPKECWRLMGFNDEEFEKAQAVNSNEQLYKQAGNSIVVNVLVEIFKNLLGGTQ